MKEFLHSLKRFMTGERTVISVVPPLYAFPEREQHLRTINDLLAQLAIAELRIETIRRMIAGRAHYDDPALQAEAYEGLIAEITAEAGTNETK
jgi:hypothetical protein